MKPDNLLLAGRTWKLADFNLACDFDPKFYMTRRVGTRPYAAPEVKEKKLGRSSSDTAWLTKRLSQAIHREV